MTNDVLRELETWLRETIAKHKEYANVYRAHLPKLAAAFDHQEQFERYLDALSALLREKEPEVFVLVPVIPTEEMWGSLARQIVFWQRGGRATGITLYRDLRMIGMAIPAWLLEEIPENDHVPPKGTVAAVIYRAMIEARPLPSIPTEGGLTVQSPVLDANP